MGIVKLLVLSFCLTVSQAQTNQIQCKDTVAGFGFFPCIGDICVAERIIRSGVPVTERFCLVKSINTHWREICCGLTDTPENVWQCCTTDNCNENLEPRLESEDPVSTNVMLFCPDNVVQDNILITEVRLFDNDGMSNRSGRVEVLVEGEWKTVCNNNREQSQQIANTVCSIIHNAPVQGRVISSVAQGSIPLYACDVRTCGRELNCTRINDSCTELRVECPSLDDVCAITSQQPTVNTPAESNNTAYQFTTSGPTTSTQQPATNAPVECSCATTTYSPTSSNRPTTSESPTSRENQCTAVFSSIILIAIVCVLVAVIIALTMALVCTCVCMSRKSAEILDRRAISAMNRELNSPVYEFGNSAKFTPVEPKI